MNRRISQRAAILAHLESGKSITPLEALNLFGCMRLADVIFKLKKEGHVIETEIAYNFDSDKRYAEYHYVGRLVG